MASPARPEMERPPALARRGPGRAGSRLGREGALNPGGYLRDLVPRGGFAPFGGAGSGYVAVPASHDVFSQSEATDSAQEERDGAWLGHRGGGRQPCRLDGPFEGRGAACRGRYQELLIVLEDVQGAGGTRERKRSGDRLERDAHT